MNGGRMSESATKSKCFLNTYNIKNQAKRTAERVEQQVYGGRSNKSMNFVHSISEEDEQLEQKRIKKNQKLSWAGEKVIPLLSVSEVKE